MIHNANIKNFTQLTKIMEEDCDNKVEAYAQYQQVFIRSEKNELMIRDNKPLGELVIAYIQLHKRRQGSGQKILDFLKEYGKVNGYTKIVAESVLTDEFKQFIFKNGFVNQRFAMYCYELALNE